MGSCKQLILNSAILVAILSSATTGATTRPPITCHVTVFQNSRSASLVCRYNKDLGDRRENYDITFCPQNSRCLDAISCNWDGRGQVLHCVTTPDFKGATCALSDEQTGDLVCQLPNVRPHHSGSYTCHLVPPDGRDQQSCAAVVPSEDNKDEEKSESVHVWVLTAVCIVFAVAVIVILIVLVVWITRKKKKREESPRSKDKSEKQDHHLKDNSDSTIKDQEVDSSALLNVDLGEAQCLVVPTSGVSKEFNQELLKLHKDGKVGVVLFQSGKDIKNISENDPSTFSLLTHVQGQSNQDIRSSTPVKKTRRSSLKCDQGVEPVTNYSQILTTVHLSQHSPHHASLSQQQQ